MSSADEEIRKLKLEAIQLKQSGDTKGALAKLQEARNLEFSTIKLEDLTDPVKLKQLALHYKQQGRLEDAKQALLKSKQQESVATEKAGKSVEQVAHSVPTKDSESKAKNQDNVSTIETPQSERPVEAFSDPSLASDTDDVDDEDMKMLQSELCGSEGDDDDNFDPDAVDFSEAEMLNLEMMTEFKVGGLGAPSQEDYEGMIAKCKQLALKFKNSGEKEKAIDQLRKMKQFQVVMKGLSHVEDGLNLKSNDDDDQWLEELNQDDHDLMRELFSDPSINAESDGFDLEELKSLDEEAIRDAAELGMSIPTPEEVMQKAEEKRVLAIQLKRSGDLKGASTALVEFKGLKYQAERLQSLLSPGKSDISDGDLEALVTGAVLKSEPAPRKPRTAEELRAEAIRLRDEKKIQEATDMLKLYKLALKKEADAKEMKRCQEMLNELSKEISFAKEQTRLFAFYSRFVDGGSGVQLQNAWIVYATQCSKACGVLKAKGSGGHLLEKKDSRLRTMKWDSLPILIRGATDFSETRVEVSVLGIRELDKHKSAKKIRDTQPALVRASVSIQLPLTEEDSGPIDLTFESSPTVKEDPLHYLFDGSKSQYVTLARGDSRLAKNVVRRMERRKIQIQVHHSTIKQPAARSFFGRSTAEPEPELVYIGKVVLELKDFLASNCIAGEFPIMGSGGKPCGGFLSLCVRTGAPFDPEALVESDVDGKLQSYQCLVLSDVQCCNR